MAIVISCPQCQAQMPVREELAGRQVKCPRCEGVFTVQVEAAPPPLPVMALPADEEPEVRVVAEPAPFMPHRRPSAEGPRITYRPCPKCGTRGPEKVKWTLWGSFYGPALFHHVRCLECGYAYNGKTGKSNLVPAIFFVTVPAVLLVLLIWFIVWLLKVRGIGN